MANGQQESGSDKAFGWLLLLAIFIVLFYVVWWFFAYEIKDAIRWYRYGEMWLLNHFIGPDYTIVWRDFTLNFKRWFAATPRIVASCEGVDQPQALGACLNNDTVLALSHLAMKPVSYVFSGIMILMALWVIFLGPRTHYRRDLSLEKLIKAHAKAFPVIKPFVNFNPSRQPTRPPGSPVPVKLPLFAEALGPEEWVAYNNIPAPDGELDREAAKQAFKKQLGPPWRGSMRLPAYLQVILAAFCLKAARRREEADALLGELGECWDHQKGLRLPNKLVRRARRILRDKSISAETLAKCNRHAYVTTAMMRGLQTAREEGGVMAPAQFLWLRGHNRTLWYPLNNLGRQSHHMEALGAMAHFKQEKMTQRPVPRPQLDEAVDSIANYMASNRARPIPQLDYSGSEKQRAVKKWKRSTS
jgi:intracellular multiplication protein IcmP